MTSIPRCLLWVENVLSVSRQIITEKGLAKLVADGSIYPPGKQPVKTSLSAYKRGLFCFAKSPQQYLLFGCHRSIFSFRTHLSLASLFVSALCALQHLMLRAQCRLGGPPRHPPTLYPSPAPPPLPRQSPRESITTPATECLKSTSNTRLALGPPSHKRMRNTTTSCFRHTKPEGCSRARASMSRQPSSRLPSFLLVRCPSLLFRLFVGSLFF